MTSMKNAAFLTLLVTVQRTSGTVRGFIPPNPNNFAAASARSPVQNKWWRRRFGPRERAVPLRSTFDGAGDESDGEKSVPRWRALERLWTPADVTSTKETEQCGTSLHTSSSWAPTLPPLLLSAAAAAPLPAEAYASSGAVPSALWAYAHYFSIIAIFGCLSAERTIVKPNMTEEEEASIVKLDLIYGLMAVLLIGSGFARATNFGKGSEFYLNESLFWVKMSLSGIWGGLSLFPSVTFYKRNFARKQANEEEVPPVSEKLAKRLRQVIDAEITAVLSIPLLATLMSRGVGYWQDFPWQFGLAASILATVGSFYFYASQAFAWSEEGDDVTSAMD